MALTLRQQILKRLYPLFIWGRNKTQKNRVSENKANVKPSSSFYTLSATLNNGNELSFDTLKGKKVLVVNTASDCGYTPQYAELQKLYQQSKDKLEIIAFPANDFKEQEKGSDEDIAQFCSVNFGVSFPVTKKSAVIKNNQQNPVFKWLTDKALNGWNDAPPSWNFAKFLINEDGTLTHYFDPAVSPLGTEVMGAVQL